MEKELKPLNILYFEDEPANFDRYADLKYGLNVEYALSGSEGIRLIEENPLKWDAIILDANMPYEQGDNPSIHSLLRIEKKINDLSGNSIPYFVYSALPEDLGLLPKEDWQDQPYFDKNDGNSFDSLCKNIIQAAGNNRSINAITKRNYPEITEIPKLDCTPPSESALVNILSKLEINRTPEYDPDKDETIYNSIRVVLEWFFRYVYSKGGISTQPTTTNINACSKDLGNENNHFAPCYIKRSAHSLVENCNQGSHGTQIRMDTKSGKCPYAVKSSIYDLLNLLHWSINL